MPKLTLVIITSMKKLKEKANGWELIKDLKFSLEIFLITKEKYMWNNLAHSLWESSNLVRE